MGIFNKKPKATKLDNLDELNPLLDSNRPVLIDFYQVGCAPCQVMDGIMNELAREYGESAHIVKADIGRVPGAAQAFRIRSTPTFVLFSRAPEKTSKKARKKAQKGGQTSGERRVAQRWRTSGLVKKDQLQRLLESNGAVPQG
jgi:thioredoxin 1